MPEPKATIDDLYNQNTSIIEHLARLNENLHLIREALYGRTRAESGQNWEEPKHGEWGAISETAAATENYLTTIDKSLGEIRRSGSLK